MVKGSVSKFTEKKSTSNVHPRKEVGRQRLNFSPYFLVSLLCFFSATPATWTFWFCWNEPLSGAFICVFSRKVLIVKVVYRWMNLFKPVMHSFCWTTAILKLFQKHNGPSRSLKHGVWKFLHLQSIQDERKKNEKLVKANWVFFTTQTKFPSW